MIRTKLWLMKFSAKDQINQIQSKLKKLFNQAGFDSIIKKHDITAIKTHFGEKGVNSYLSADYIEPIVRKIKSCGAKPFVSDTNVLYKSLRDNAIDHIALAHEHGFTYETLGANIIIADGIVGKNEVEIDIDAPINKTVSIATEFITANSIIVMTHATGHLATGFGATIKNIGMGMSSKKGKLTQHSVSKPIINSRKCTNCGVCSQWCPADAITIKKDYSEIINEKCIGCGECLAVCRFDSVNFRWNATNNKLQQQIAEHALGIIRAKTNRIGFFTFLINMTKQCDCIPHKSDFILEDIGVIAGTDPVAIDQAVLDLTKMQGQNINELSFPGIDGEEQLRYGEKIGLGSRDYILEEVK